MATFADFRTLSPSPSYPRAVQTFVHRVSEQRNEEINLGRKMSSFLARGCRSSTLKSTTSAALGDYARGRRYCAEKKDEPQRVVEKATSTAEEFLRQAREKSEAVGESAREVVEDAKEAVLGESEERKQQKVEKGNYDKIRRD